MFVAGILAARKPSSGTEIKEKESFSQLFQLKSLDKQDTWYPTLRRTVWVLSQLHEFVKVRSRMMSRLTARALMPERSQLYLTISRKRPLTCADSRL